MFEHINPYAGEGQPAEMLIGQGPLIPVNNWIEVWSKLGEATSGLPWGIYVAWVVLDHGGDQIAAAADSRDTYIARYGSGPGKLEAIHGL
jgi:hypothetical protein